MAVNKRSRTDIQTEKAIEAFGAMAEKPLPALPSLLEPDLVTLPSPEAPDAPDAPAAVAAPMPKAESKSPARKAARAVSSVLAPAMADWKVRNREPKTGGINFRASSSQLELLRTAALVEEISQQKVLERLVWPILEEKYGKGSAE